MGNSLKQLIRTPVKALLFFLLIALGALLLTLGSVFLVQSLQRIQAAENQFTTIGTVEQMPSATATETVTWNEWLGEPYTTPINEYDKILTKDVLSFSGAKYLIEPESRPYYQAYLPNYKSTSPYDGRHSSYILEFTPLEDCCLSSPSAVRVTRILLNKESTIDVNLRRKLDQKENLEEGDTIQLSDYSVEHPANLEKWKTYICTVIWNVRRNDGYYMVYPPPYSSQFGVKDRSYLLPEEVRGGNRSAPPASRSFEYSLTNIDTGRVEEVTADFYETGGRGQAWLTWVDMHKKYEKWFWVLPTNSLKLLPSFHEKQMYLKQGREISSQEFAEGSLVCMVPEGFATRNLLSIGDTITLPLHFALYGYYPDQENVYPTYGGGYPTYFRGYSPLDADLVPYDSFWEADYEIIGIYQPIMENVLLCGKTEIARDMFIIPTKSVRASDKNNIAHYGPMNTLTTSFQIPNGMIEEFDRDLHEAVPETERLIVSYDDNGYEEVMGSLRNARLTAVLLFLVGVLATLAIVILLLFFFVVKQRKRTAVERSLGMTKKQCRVSLIAGLLVLTLAASIVGSIGGGLILSSMDPDADITDTTEFSTKYSLWAQNRPDEIELDTADMLVTGGLYLAIPILLVLIVFLLALIFVNRNLKLEPILLLSAKTE